MVLVRRVELKVNSKGWETDQLQYLFQVFGRTKDAFTETNIQRQLFKSFLN